MPTVTVLIPTHNRQHMISDALESVFAQTYPDFDILVVDDGSTDKTEEVLQPWLSKIRYEKKENGGPSSARNVGLRQIESEFVAFLDSDDRWEPTFLQSAMKEFSEHPQLGLVTLGCVLMPMKIPRPGRPASSVRGDLFLFLFQKNFITTSGTVVRRESLQKVGLFKEELKQNEDYDMWLRIAKDYPISFLKEHPVLYRCHPQNTSKDILQQLLTLRRVIEVNYDPARVPDKILQYRRAEVLTKLGREYLRQSKPTRARLCFRDSIRLYPWKIRVWRDFLRTWL